MKTSFYPTDISYTIKGGKAIIQMYGRTIAGEQICVIDDAFEPYFYVTGDVDPKDLELVEKDDYKVVRVEKVKKNLNEKPVDALKVVVNIPKGVPVIKDAIKEWPDVSGVYEYDILFARRYLIDNQLLPLTRTVVEGEETAWNARVPCIKVETISVENNEAFVSPKILALDIETYNPTNKVDMKNNPILMIGLYGKDFSRVITWKEFPTKEDYIEFVPSEADMLQRFVELVHEHKPDIITGYFTDGFDFPYIIERAKKHKVKLDIGLDYSDVSLRGKIRPEAQITGIVHLDIYKFIRRVMARSLKTDTYSLDSVSKELLGAEKDKVDMEHFFKAWDKGGKDLEPYCHYNLQDCKLTYDLTEKMMPNLIEFVRMIGLSPFDIDRMSFSTFVEWYLIKEATKRNEIILNRPSRTQELRRVGDRIKGAFVYEPKPGFYENISVFDYRSLYPSIIASHHISRGTLKCDCCAEPKVETERGDIWFCQKKKGLFSELIGDIIVRRANIKKQLKKNPDPLLAARVEALKTLAASFYGYMGFAPARWYCIECAEATTAWARHYIHQTIDKAKEEGFTVLYSDTDSVFLLLEKKTKEDALRFVDEINAQLPELMELEYEGFYPAGIFVSLKSAESGAKKKYALLGENGEMTIKGFETVRRNWSFIAKETQREVLRIVLQEKDKEKAKKYVRTVVDDLRNNKIPLDKVLIHTAITKNIDAYASIGPHVAAAKRMELRGKSVGAGSIIDYVVGKGKGLIREKVRLPDEIKQSEYDGEYYVTHQVIPGVERIFAVLGIKVDEFTEKTSQSSLTGF